MMMSKEIAKVMAGLLVYYDDRIKMIFKIKIKMII